jgi:Glycosyltransferase like family
MKSPITFVVAVNNRAVLENNFLASPCLRTPHPHQILIQEGYPSAATAYNAAIDESANDLIVFIHQDVILLEPWLSQLQNALDSLESHDPNWGVLGCGGTAYDGHGRGHLYSSGLGVLGEPFKSPVQIRTLDEIVLILRKSSGLRFDNDLPHFHLYGTDICLRAESAGRKNYVIPAFCVHNTDYGLILPIEFYQSCSHIRQVWKDSLPIQTPCIKITRLKVPIYRRRLLELYLRYLRRNQAGTKRVNDVRKLIETLSVNHQNA